MFPDFFFRYFWKTEMRAKRTKTFFFNDFRASKKAAFIFVFESWQVGTKYIPFSKKKIRAIFFYKLIQKGRRNFELIF